MNFGEKSVILFKKFKMKIGNRMNGPPPQILKVQQPFQKSTTYKHHSIVQYVLHTVMNIS